MYDIDIREPLFDYLDEKYGKNHEKHVEEHIPKEWGIIRVAKEAGGISVAQFREALPNSKAKLERQIEWMWRPELNNMLAQNALPKYRAKSKRFVQEKLLERVEPHLLKQQMCEELFERDYTIFDDVE